MLRAVGYLHTFQSLINTPHAFAGRDSGIEQRKFYIFKNREFIYQIETLKYKAEVSIAQVRTRILGVTRNFLVEKPEFTGSRIIEQTNHIQQSGLSAARRSHNGYKFSLSDFQIHFIQSNGLYALCTEYLTESNSLYHIQIIFLLYTK